MTGEIRTKHILLCKCRGDRIDPDLSGKVDGYVKTRPVKLTTISDLCGLAASNKDLPARLLTADDDCLVIGCYRRSMGLLFDKFRGKDCGPVTFSHINLIELSAGDVFDRIDEFCGNEKGNAVITEISGDPEWPSWYPLIDYSRCTSCGQCADFCLFGVYEKTEEHVMVINPRACKNNCPACARICPATAIIFPKYRNGGAIGGSDEIDEKAEQQRQLNDIENFLGDDVYMALQRRKLKRQSIIREEAMNKAISERDKALDSDLNRRAE